MQISERQSQIDDLTRKYLYDNLEANNHSASQPQQKGRRSPTDAEVIEKLLNARTDKGRRLYEGDISGYPSQSEADQAFVNKLYWLTRDETQIYRIIQGSGLMRDKWNRPDYLKRTYTKAANLITEVYEWDNPSLIFPEPASTTNSGSEQSPLSPFERADLSRALREGVEPPESLVSDILLKGRVHSIYSAGGTGKTFKMLYLVKRVIEQGLPVIIFDMENGLRIIAERLEALGITPKQAKLIHYYPFPRMPIDDGVIEKFEELLDEINPALVVFDSWINCLAACGLDENSSVDIAAWADAYTQKARHRDIASLILDHVPKEGNTARGSGRKLDYVDVQWELRNPQPFNRNIVGRIDLHLRKDREGWLPSILTFAVGGSENGFIFKRSDGLLTRVDDEGLLSTDRTVREALASFGSSGARDKDWREAARARSIPKTTYYRSRKILLEKGYVEQVMDKYFIKVLQTDESQEVPNSPMGPLPDTPSLDEEITEGSL